MTRPPLPRWLLLTAVLAVALAAVLGNPARFADKRVGLVISGANIDSRILASVLIRGLVRSGLLVRIRVEVSD